MDTETTIKLLIGLSKASFVILLVWYVDTWITKRIKVKIKGKYNA